MTVYNYSNTAVETTLVNPLTDSSATCALVSTSGFPVSYPYTLAIDYATASLEVVTVTGLVGGALAITRGQDGTAAQAHDAGAVVVHACVARDLYNPQVHMDADGNVHGVGVSADVVGTDTTQILTNKTISGASNTLSSIADGSITALSASKLTGSFGSGTFVSAADATVPLTATGTATATAHLLDCKKGADVKASVAADGTIASAAGISATTSVAAGTQVYAGGTGDSVPFAANVPLANTADLVSLARDSAVKFGVDKDGDVACHDIAPTGAASVTGAISGASIGVTGAVTGASAAITGAITGNTIELTGAASGDDLVVTKVTGDANKRLIVESSGKMMWGNGTDVVDTNLYRSAADTLKTDDSLTVTGTLTAGKNLAVTGIGGLVGTKYATGGTLATSSSYGTEVAMTAWTGGDANVVFKNGYLYRADLQINAFQADAARGVLTIQLHKTVNTTANIWQVWQCSGYWVGDYQTYHFVAYLKNSSGGDITTPLGLGVTAIEGAGNASINGNATVPCILTVTCIGATADYTALTACATAIT